MGVAIYPGRCRSGASRRTDSAVNHLRATITSIVPLGNRVRVRVGELVAEVTAASARPARRSREGDVVVASFKATAARIVPLA